MIDVVDAADGETWGAISRGERPLDWETWFGNPAGADYLTDEGKKVARRAADDLTAFFGPGWLNQALQPDLGPGGPRIPGLGGSSPALALAPGRRAGAYVESIRWWASLQLLVQERVQGFETVRRDARNDLTTQRLTHALTQARLAAIGSFLGLGVAVEPGKAGGPGDVLFRVGRDEIFVEIVTFGPDKTRELEEARQQRHMMHLFALAAPPIYWEGDVPGVLNQAEEARWLRETTDAAARCVQTGQPVEICGPGDLLLVVRPGIAPPGTRLTGPHLGFAFGERLTGILGKKGAQTRGASIAWIWVEDYGGIHALHPFTSSPLAQKIATLARLARDALGDYPHVAGIAWSGAARCSRVPADEQAQTPDGVAIQRGLPIEHLRQTVIVSRHLVLPGQISVLVRACEREPHWLDWALQRLGIGGGFRSLLSQPPEGHWRPHTLLWTPAADR